MLRQLGRLRGRTRKSLQIQKLTPISVRLLIWPVLAFLPLGQAQGPAEQDPQKRVGQ